MENLYDKLLSTEYSEGNYRKCDFGEEMTVVEEFRYGDWEPRYLIDERDKFAFEFMNADGILCTIRGVKDVDIESIPKTYSPMIGVIKRLEFSNHSYLDSFLNGVAKVRWQIYYEDDLSDIDDDGYGMRPNDSCEIYGFIDRRGRVVRKFHFSREGSTVDKVMRPEAEAEANAKKQD